jgi:hypothetical protein
VVHNKSKAENRDRSIGDLATGLLNRDRNINLGIHDFAEFPTLVSLYGLKDMVVYRPRRISTWCGAIVPVREHSRNPQILSFIAV